jgi:hypothetical protein
MSIDQKFLKETGMKVTHAARVKASEPEEVMIKADEHQLLAVAIGDAICGMSNLCSGARQDVADLLTVVTGMPISVSGTKKKEKKKFPYEYGTLFSFDDLYNTECNCNAKVCMYVSDHRDGDAEILLAYGKHTYLDETEHANLRLASIEEIESFFDILQNFEIVNLKDEVCNLMADHHLPV